MFGQNWTWWTDFRSTFCLLNIYFEITAWYGWGEKQRYYLVSVFKDQAKTFTSLCFWCPTWSDIFFRLKLPELIPVKLLWKYSMCVIYFSPAWTRKCINTYTPCLFSRCTMLAPGIKSSGCRCMSTAYKPCFHAGRALHSDGGCNQLSCDSLLPFHGLWPVRPFSLTPDIH